MKPGVDGIGLARGGLDDDGGGVGPAVVDEETRGRPAHLVPAQQAGLVEQDQVARGVAGLVDAVELAGHRKTLERAADILRCPDPGADLGLDRGDGQGDAGPFGGGIGSRLRHAGDQPRPVLPQVDSILALAAVAVADQHGIQAGVGIGILGQEVLGRAVVRAARKQQHPGKEERSVQRAGFRLWHDGAAILHQGNGANPVPIAPIGSRRPVPAMPAGPGPALQYPSLSWMKRQP